MNSLPVVIRTARWMVRDTFRQSLASRLFWVMLGVTALCTLFCLGITVDAPGERPRHPDEIPDRLPRGADPRAAENGKQVAEALVKLKSNYETVEGFNDLSIEYANADVALCAFGVTAYELAASGTPAVYLGLTEDHAASASAFAEAGMGISLGVAGKASDADIVRTVRWLLHKPLARRDMRNAGPNLVFALPSSVKPHFS